MQSAWKKEPRLFLAQRGRYREQGMTRGLESENLETSL